MLFHYNLHGILKLHLLPFRLKRSERLSSDKSNEWASSCICTEDGILLWLFWSWLQWIRIWSFSVCPWKILSCANLILTKVLLCIWSSCCPNTSACLHLCENNAIFICLSWLIAVKLIVLLSNATITHIQFKLLQSN